MPRPEPTFMNRAAGALVALAGSAAAAPDSATGADVALGTLLAEELMSGGFDLQRLAHRWVAWMKAGNPGLDPWTREALGYLGTYDAPPEPGTGDAGSGPLVRVLPIAIRAAASPRNLVGATVHVAMLTHPDPRPAWAAVAVNVALARFLLGQRDFIPDVLEALRENTAPPEVLDAARRIPLVRSWDALLGETANASPAVGAMATALWFAHHEPKLARGVDRLAEQAAQGRAGPALAAALMAARDGEAAVPREIARASEAFGSMRELAARLCGGTAG